MENTPFSVGNVMVAHFVFIVVTNIYVKIVMELPYALIKKLKANV